MPDCIGCVVLRCCVAIIILYNSEWWISRITQQTQYRFNDLTHYLQRSQFTSNRIYSEDSLTYNHQQTRGKALLVSSQLEIQLRISHSHLLSSFSSDIIVYILSCNLNNIINPQHENCQLRCFGQLLPPLLLSPPFHHSPQPYQTRLQTTRTNYHSTTQDLSLLNCTQRRLLSALQLTIDADDFVSCQGFKLEIYTLQTTDKVTLEMWRLLKEDRKLVKPYPILLMHGLLDCSVSWFLQADKSRCLPYMLAQEGYQVWLGNNRGNVISQKQDHPDQQFWDFNLDHLIEHDQPTLINGVLQISKKEKLIYVGHSQGSVQFVLSLGLHQHLPNKIAGFIGLGTVLSLANLDQHLLLKILDRFKIIEVIRWLGFKKLLVISRMLAKAVGILIYNCRIFHSFILSFVRMLCGYSTKDKISQHLFGVMMSHQPGGSSSNNVLQWIQCFRHGHMRKFDYGPKKNQQIYGSEVPLAYCLQHLRTLPFDSYLFRGTKDAVMSKQNFEYLVQCFNPGRIKCFQLQDYHHLQYIWSETADKDVFQKVVQIVHSLCP